MNVRLVLILMMAFAVFLVSAGVGGATVFSNSGDGSWQYQTNIIIQENSGSTLTDYQILLELNGTDFLTGVNANGTDIRFTDSSDSELSYWIEEWDDGTQTARIWVKVPTVFAGTSNNIKMWYGNPSAVSSSNGNATFTFFDNFDEPSLNVSKWTTPSFGMQPIQSVVMSDSVLSFTGNGCGGLCSDGVSLRMNQNFSYDEKVVVDTKFRFAGDSSYGSGAGLWAESSFAPVNISSSSCNFVVPQFVGLRGDNFYNTIWDMSYIDWSESNNTQITTLTMNGPWYKSSLTKKNETAFNGTLYNDYSEVLGSKEYNVDFGNVDLTWVTSAVYNCGSRRYYFDWVFVRNYASTEPTIYFDGDVDISPPNIIITSPTDGITVTTPTMTVSGTATDDTAVESVTVNGILATGTTSWSRDITLTEGSNIITVVATDTSGNTNELSVTIEKEPIFDSTPPASITNLNYTTGYTWINWTWDNPFDVDFFKVKIYLNDVFQTNVTSQTNYYNATGLNPDTQYTISTQTFDTSGNINQTWVNHTAVTNIKANTNDGVFLRLEGSYDTEGYAMGVAVSGIYAYVADYDNGLVVIDISDPTKPTLAGSYDTAGYAYGVAVSGSYAYVADVNDLIAVNISDPTNPTLAGSYDTDGYAFDVAVSGSYAYVADYANGLVVVNISDPTNLTLVGSYDTAGYAWGVAVSGSYAYVADQSNGLVVVNISDPTTPTLTGSYDTAGNARGVAISGNHAYVADDANGLVAVNISDPTKPTLVGSYDTAGSARSIAVSGSYAYVADGANGLLAVNISDPTNLTLVGNYDTANAYGVAVSGSYTYIADLNNGLVVLGGIPSIQSKVEPLSEYSSNTTFTVNYAVDDPFHLGLENISLYYNHGSGWTFYAKNSISGNGSFTFNAPEYGYYEFYSTVTYATSGRVEEAPLVADAHITIDTTPPASITNFNITTGLTWINITWNNPSDTDFNKVMLYFDGVLQANVTFPTNYYIATGLNLDTQYNISTHTVDTAGNINQTWVNVTYTPLDLTSPIVTITSPSDGASLTTSTITVSGTASDNIGVANVAVNGILVNGTTNWSADVTLIDGENNITIVATDDVGNTKSVVLTVYYNPSAVIISMGSAKVPSNSLVTIPVSIANATNITGISFDLFYNASVVSVDSIVANNSFTGSSISSNVDNINGTTRVVLTNTNLISSSTQTPVIDVTFNVTGDFGSLTNLDLENVELSNSDFNPDTPVSVVDGLITVGINGDLNDNGYVDIGDVAKVAFMVAGKVPEELNADFNDNGYVDIGDAAKIAFYLAGKVSEL